MFSGCAKHSMGSSPNHASDINPLQPSAAFVYPLKISENQKGFLIFLGVQKSDIGL